MSNYAVDQSQKPVLLSVAVVSPAPAKSFVELDGVELFTSPPFSGGNIFPTAIGTNKVLNDLTLKITTIIDLSPLTDVQKEQAMRMIRTTYTLEGGPEGKKRFRLHESRWIRIGDDLFLTKYIDFKP